MTVDEELARIFNKIIEDIELTDEEEDFIDSLEDPDE